MSHNVSTKNDYRCPFNIIILFLGAYITYKDIPVGASISYAYILFYVSTVILYLYNINYILLILTILKIYP
jgi:hypothetical protein